MLRSPITETVIIYSIVFLLQFICIIYMLTTTRTSERSQLKPIAELVLK